MYAGVQHAGAGHIVRALSPSASHIVDGNPEPGVGKPGVLVRSGATADANVLEQLTISWELILLLSAEFLTFGLVEVPLLSFDSDAQAEITFIKENRWLSPTVLAAYVLLTLPIAMGYNWFIQKWPIDLLVMLGIYTSLGAVCHVSSVYTNPEGVFVGCLSVSSFLFTLSIVKFFISPNNKYFLFSKLYIALVGILWQTTVFLTLYLVGDVLTPKSCLGSGLVSLGVTLFIIAELRLIENRICVFFTNQDKRLMNKQIRRKSVTRSFSTLQIPPPQETISQIMRKESAAEKGRILERDPFTLVIWINCATWRFLVQFILLLQKLIVEFISIFFLSLLAIWKWIVSLFAKKTPGEWLTPETLKKIFRINTSKKQNVPSPS